MWGCGEGIFKQRVTVCSIVSCDRVREAASVASYPMPRVGVEPELKMSHVHVDSLTADRNSYASTATMYSNGK